MDLHKTMAETVVRSTNGGWHSTRATIDVPAASGEMSDEAFQAFLTQALGAAAKVSCDGAVHFVAMDWRHMDDLSAVGRNIYRVLLNLCVWNAHFNAVGRRQDLKLHPTARAA